MPEEYTISEQSQIRRDKLAELQASGRDPYHITKFDQDTYADKILSDYASLNAEEYGTKLHSVAGRLVAKRVMGKASFAHLRDTKADLQLYISRDNLGDEEYAAFKKLDIGDILGCKGVVFKTKTGEITLKVTELTLLSKSLQPLPEKFHGLTDLEQRYRQRYVDLIVNPEVKDTFIKRSRIIAGIRNFLDNRGYLEVETPILTPFEIGASARPFTTHHNTLGIDMVLRIETELYLKRLIVGGIDRVYEIGRIFRNEGMDPRHNPEFTSIELYQAYTNYEGMMNLVEDLYKYLADNICGTRQIPWGELTIDLDHWTRMTMKEAVKKYSGVDYDDWKTDEDAIASAKEHNVPLPEVHTKGNILAEFFDAFVEGNLIQPTFIYDYPVDISPLAKRKPGDEEFTERFEFFINAMEGGNAFTELNNPIDQRERFIRQVKERKELEPGAKCQVDYDFINALEYGLPPTGGLGIGIDRLVMLFTNNLSIRDVILFPTMKPEGAVTAAEAAAASAGKCTRSNVGDLCLMEGNIAESQKPEGAVTAAEAAAASAGSTPSSSNAEGSVPAISDSSYPLFRPDDRINYDTLEIEPLFEEYVDFDTFAKSDFRAVKVLDCQAVPKSKKLLKFTLDDGVSKDRIILSGIHAYYEPEELVGKTLIAITNLPPRKMMGIDSCGMLISAVNSEAGEERLHLLMVDPKIPAGAKLY